MNSKLRTEKRRWRRRFISIATASAVTIFSTVSLPQHHAVVAATTASEAGHQEEEMVLSDHRRRKLTEQRRRMKEQRRRLEELWTAEAIQNLQTLDYVLDESDTSNNPRYFIRSRDGMLRPPSDIHVDEVISSLEEEGEPVLGEGTSNTEVVHHQKSKLGPTNKGHLQMMSQFQHWESGDRNLRGGDVIVSEDDIESFPELDQMSFLYDEDGPEEDLDGYDLVYIGSGDDVDIHQQEQRELSLANDFVGGSSANNFVSHIKQDPKGKGKSPPQGKDKDAILPFGKKANIFNQIFPKDGSRIGTVQAFGAQVKDAAAIEYVGIQFKDHKNKRSKWYEMPQSEALHDWFMKEMKGFPPNQKWLYRMKAKVPTPRSNKKKKKNKKEITAWMELAINIEPVEETPPPTPGPSPRPSPSPTSPPSPRPSPNPTSPPSPRPTSPPSPRPTPGPTSPPSSKPTPGPTSPPTPDPTPNPLDYVSQWTKHPTRYPTTESPTFHPTSPPSKHPTQPPTFNPTPNPTHNPSHPPTKPPTKQPSKPPTPLPTPPPTPEATEAVQQAPPQLLHKHVRDDPWEHGGKCFDEECE